MNKIRMTDLARLAGVSVATISRSLSDSPLINRVTKRRVWQVASDHGYIPARDIPEALMGSRASLALVLPWQDDAGAFDPFRQDLLAGLVEAARETRCELSISHAGPDTHADVRRIVSRSNVDAFLFLGGINFGVALGDLPKEARNCLIWGDVAPGQACASVGLDNFACGHLATTQLIRSGCRQIAYLGDSDGPGMRQRFMGYLTALAQAGLVFDPGMLFQSSPEGLAGFKGCDGLFSSGTAALETDVNRLRSAGHSLQDTVRLAGCYPGRYTPHGAVMVSFDMMEAGRLIIKKLLAIAAGEPQESVLLQPILSN